MKKKTRKKLLQLFFFLIKLNVLVIPVYILIFLDFSFPPLQNFVAFLSYKLLSCLGIQTSLNQSSLIVVREFKTAFIDIGMDCTGWKSLYMIIALAVATPGIKLKKKGLFLAFSLPLLFFINIMRIVITIYISLFEPEVFSFVHDTLWGFGLAFATLAIWLLWLRVEKRI